MVKNVGGADKKIRIVAGIVIIAAGFYFRSWWGLVGLLPLLTAFMSFCPAYTLFGMSTCGSMEKKGSCCCGGTETGEKAANE